MKDSNGCYPTTNRSQAGLWIQVQLYIVMQYAAYRCRTAPHHRMHTALWAKLVIVLQAIGYMMNLASR